jgi:hypothetical protein
MKTEHQTDKRRKSATPKSRSSDTSDPMTPDELVAFEQHVVHGEDPAPPAGPADDAERMTKSGRLSLDQMKDAIDAADKSDKSDKNE